MKLCKECNLEKEEENFRLIYGRKRKKQYIRHVCKKCESNITNGPRKEYRKNYNAKNKEKKNNRTLCVKTEVRNIINQLKSFPCKDCGNIFPPVAMDFDHINNNNNNNKKYTIGRMLSSAYKIDLILNEIAKCELVCACCHRIRTLDRRGKIKNIKTRLANFIDKIKAETPCLICNLHFPPECMDFDHRIPKNKKFNIEIMRRYSIKNMNVLLEELDKCDILCACCHRIKTHENK